MTNYDEDSSCAPSVVTTATRWWVWLTVVFLALLSTFMAALMWTKDTLSPTAYPWVKTMWNGRDKYALAWFVVIAVIGVGNVWNIQSADDDEAKTGWTRFWMFSTSTLIFAAIVFAIVMARCGLALDERGWGMLLGLGAASAIPAIGSIAHASC